MKKMLLAAALGLGATAVIGQAQQPAPAKAAAAKPAPDPKKRICRDDAPLGSRISSMICHTQAEWDTIDQESGDKTRNMMRSQQGSRY